MVVLNKVVPNFHFTATNGVEASIKDYKGKTVILYFYPKDNTPGCTTESCDFRDNFTAFDKQDVVIFGISRDSLKSHENFKAKYEFPFELINDEDESLCTLFDVIKEKNMYGRKVMGIERSTFIIDKNGKLTHEFRKVKVKGHVAELLTLLTQ